MKTSPGYLHAIVIAACMVCSFCYIQTAYCYWKPKYNRHIFAAFVAFLMGFLNWGSLFLENAILGYILYFLVEILILKFGTHISRTQALFASISSALYTLCIQGIVIGTAALILGKNLYQVITVSNWLLATFAITMVIKTCFLYFFHIEVVKRSTLILLRTTKELDAVLMQHSALFVFMLFYSYNYYYNLDLIWFSAAQIILSVLMLILYALILRYGTRVSTLLEEELMNERIQQQLGAQLAQYDSYRTILTQVEDFKYHFRECMLGMDELLTGNLVAEAQSRMQESYPMLLQMLPTKKLYSNNELLNALLFNWDNHIQKYGVQFESTVYLPPEFDHKAEELLSIFAILEDIFLQLVQPSKNPQIKIVGKEIQNNFTISVSGSVLGSVEQRYDLPYFVTPNGTKIKSLYHRLVSIAGSLNATLFWSYSKENKIFQIVMSVHA